MTFEECSRQAMNEIGVPQDVQDIFILYGHAVTGNRNKQLTESEIPICLALSRIMNRLELGATPEARAESYALIRAMAMQEKN